MNNRIVRLGLVAAAVAVVALVGFALLTGRDTGARTGGTPQNATPAQTDPGTLVITRISGPGDDYDLYRVRSDGTGLGG